MSEQTQPVPKKRLLLDKETNKIGGVIGGISKYYDIDPLGPRILALLALFSGVFPFILPVYIVLWLVMDSEAV